MPGGTGLAGYILNFARVINPCVRGASLLGGAMLFGWRGAKAGGGLPFQLIWRRAHVWAQEDRFAWPRAGIAGVERSKSIYKVIAHWHSTSIRNIAQ